jgi:16S rRNA (cytidine1402-2'-O)-methyltransferase
LPTDAYFFGGFLPGRAGERRTALEAHRERKETIVFYEAPHRVVETLVDLVEILGAERRVCVARELTKLHEEFLRGTAGEVLMQLRERGEVRGEITLVIAGASESKAQQKSKKTVVARIRELIASGKEEKDALKIAAKEFDLGKSEVYREWQRHKR